MKKYQYQFLRYVHDRVSGEFVNVGLIMYSKEDRFLQCRVITRYARISNFFIKIKGNHLMSLLKYFENTILAKVEDVTNGKLVFDNVDLITTSVLPKDDSALIATEIKPGLDFDLNRGFEHMYSRFVNKYTGEPETNRHDDNYAWKTHYKEYFDKYGISKQLKKHVVTTHSDNIDFDKAWKNGAWNCYQGLSLDLSRDEAIKNKIYRWSGVIKELEKSNEPIHLYFLSTTPKNKKLLQLVDEAFKVQNKNLTVKLVHENEAEHFAKKVKAEMDVHFNNS